MSMLELIKQFLSFPFLYFLNTFIYSRQGLYSSHAVSPRATTNLSPLWLRYGSGSTSQSRRLNETGLKRGFVHLVLIERSRSAENLRKTCMKTCWKGGNVFLSSENRSAWSFHGANRSAWLNTVSVKSLINWVHKIYKSYKSCILNFL